MWVLPTYGRPGRCQDALDSIAAAAPTEGVVVVDGDPDPAYDALRLPPGWRVWRLARNGGVCAALNLVFAHGPDEPWYGFISDDSIVVTPDWSAPLIEAAGAHGFANSADGFRANIRMHGAVVFGGDLLRAFGWWAPPGLVHCFVDDAWERLGRALGNWTRVPSVMVEHRHCDNGQAEVDVAYENGTRKHLFTDQRTFYSAVLPELAGALDRAEPVVAAALTPEQRRLTRARCRTVFIGTPIARAPCWEYTKAFAETCVALDRLGVRFLTCFIVGNSNLPRARNSIAARFIASGMSDLLLIDDDMAWDANAVVRLLASDKAVIAGVGRKKVDVPVSQADVWCCKFPDDAAAGLVQDDMGNARVERVGAGFMRIERSVFELMMLAHPEWKGKGAPELSELAKACYYRFFKFGDADEMGEDYVFAERWRELGGEIWIDPTIKLGHSGAKLYEGRIADIMAEAPAGLPSAKEAA